MIDAKRETAGKPRDIDKWNTCERTIKISNIPSWISIDILDWSFGIAFITFETIETHTCLMNNLGHENKFFFSSSNVYSGPLLIEESAMEPSEPAPGDEFRVLVTNPTDPDDALAIKIGNLYVDASKKQKLDVQSGLDQIRTFEKQQEYAGKNNFAMLTSEKS
ncbi:unnamed protein product [Rotaria magnacalcarata]